MLRLGLSGLSLGQRGGGGAPAPDPVNHLYNGDFSNGSNRWGFQNGASMSGGNDSVILPMTAGKLVRTAAQMDLDTYGVGNYVFEFEIMENTGVTRLWFEPDSLNGSVPNIDIYPTGLGVYQVPFSFDGDGPFLLGLRTFTGTGYVEIDNLKILDPF